VIHVIATVELRPGTRDRFLHEFALLEPLVAAEDGCLEYGAAVDLASGLAVQASPRPDVVIVVEKWTTLDALMTHLAAPHMKAYRERVTPYLIGMTLQVLAPAADEGASRLAAESRKGA
jgi:quinol monooxygenase YgiN